MTDIKDISKDARYSISVSTYKHNPSSQSAFTKVLELVSVGF